MCPDRVVTVPVVVNAAMTLTTQQQPTGDKTQEAILQEFTQSKQNQMNRMYLEGYKRK